MRALLRCRRRGGNPHDRIDHVAIMWGTDGVRVFTVDLDLHRRSMVCRC